MYIALGIISVLILIPLLVPVYVRITDVDGRRVRLVIRFLGFTFFKAFFFLRIKNHINPQLLMRRKGKTHVALDFKNLFRKEPENPFLSAILKVFHIKKLYLRLTLGTGDAAATTLVCGALQSAFAVIIGIFDNRISRAGVYVSPNFEKSAVSLSLCCIIRVRSADIIRDVIRKKGGKKNAPDRKHTQNNDVRA